MRARVCLVAPGSKSAIAATLQGLWRVPPASEVQVNNRSSRASCTLMAVPLRADGTWMATVF